MFGRATIRLGIGPHSRFIILKNFNCILACMGLVGASRKSPCSVIIIIIIESTSKVHNS